MEFKVLIERTCSTCDGVGIIVHPLWREFNKIDDELMEANKPMLPQEQIEEWFLYKGLSKVPPEEIECTECNEGNVVDVVSPDIVAILKEAFHAGYQHCNGESPLVPDRPDFETWYENEGLFYLMDELPVPARGDE